MCCCSRHHLCLFIYQLNHCSKCIIERWYYGKYIYTPCSYCIFIYHMYMWIKCLMIYSILLFDSIFKLLILSTSCKYMERNLSGALEPWINGVPTFNVAMLTCVIYQTAKLNSPPYSYIMCGCLCNGFYVNVIEHFWSASQSHGKLGGAGSPLIWKWHI